MAEQWRWPLVAYSIASGPAKTVIELHSYKGNNAAIFANLLTSTAWALTSCTSQVLAAVWQDGLVGSAQCIMRDGTDIVFVLVGDVDDRCDLPRRSYLQMSSERSRACSMALSRLSTRV